MSYTLGERIYGIQDVGTLGAGAGYSQRMRDVYAPYDVLGAENVVFVSSATARDESFEPLAQSEELVSMGKGTLLLLGAGVVGLLWWMVSAARKPAKTVEPVEMPRSAGW